MFRNLRFSLCKKEKQLLHCLLQLLKRTEASESVGFLFIFFLSHVSFLRCTKLSTVTLVVGICIFFFMIMFLRSYLWLFYFILSCIFQYVFLQMVSFEISFNGV